MFFCCYLVLQGSGAEINGGKPYIEQYDAEGNLVKSYSDEEIQILMEEAKESNVLTEPEVADDTPYIHTYDENNHLIDSSVDGAVEAQQSKLAALAYSTYGYKATTFSSNVWVKGGSYFYTPADITINPKQKFGGLTIRLFAEGYSTESGRIKIGNFVGGVHIPLSGLRNGSGNHKIQFLNSNTNGSPIYLNAGTVYYN